MKPLVPRSLRFEVDERVSRDGRVLVALKDEEVLQIIEELKRLNVESVAVGFLFSYVNPSHEKRVGELLETELP